jgi:hypothetical protein
MHHEKRRLGPRLQDDRDNLAVASTIAGGQLIDQTDIGARLTRQRTAVGEILSVTHRTCIVCRQDVRGAMTMVQLAELRRAGHDGVVRVERIRRDHKSAPISPRLRPDHGAYPRLWNAAPMRCFGDETAKGSPIPSASDTMAEAACATTEGATSATSATSTTSDLSDRTTSSEPSRRRLTND